MPNRLTKGTALVGSINVSGTTINKIATGTVSLNPGSINSNVRGSVTFTLTGADTNDIIVMNPPAALDDDLLYVGAAVTAANTVTVYLYNPHGTAIDDSARTWSYLHIAAA